MARLFDLSLPISPSMPLYPGDAPPAVRELQSIARGDALTASEFTLGCHIGTHVDAPAHFLAGGVTLERLPLEHFTGPAVVIPLNRLESGSIPERHHILIQSSNSALLGEPTFRPDYIPLSLAQANALLARDPLSIGFDYYSLDAADSERFPCHMAAARYGIPVFVCLNLAGIQPGEYWFTGLPLPIPGLEGCPVRAILAR